MSDASRKIYGRLSNAHLVFHGNNFKIWGKISFYLNWRKRKLLTRVFIRLALLVLCVIRSFTHFMSLATAIALILVNYTTCNCNSFTQCLRILTTTTFYHFPYKQEMASRFQEKEIIFRWLFKYRPLSPKILSQMKSMIYSTLFHLN